MKQGTRYFTSAVLLIVTAACGGQTSDDPVDDDTPTDVKCSNDPDAEGCGTQNEHCGDGIVQASR